MSKVILTRADRKEESKGIGNEVTCMICLERVKCMTKLSQCLHYFCFDCIQKWVEVTNCCPLCKVPSLSLHRFATPVNGKTKVIKRLKIRAKQQEYVEDVEDYTHFADVCFVCGDDGTDAEMLVCDNCDYRVAHLKCAGFKIVPQRAWHCDLCRE